MFDKHRSNKPVAEHVKESVTIQDGPAMSAREPAVNRSAVIGPGISISGDVSASSDLHINGKIKGSSVHSSHSVEIGESGHVTAHIRAKMIKISGEVKGDITGSEKVLITRTGQVLGNISAPRVQLEDGAIYKGSIDMTPAEVSKPATPPAETKETSPSRPDPAIGAKSSSGNAAAGPGASSAADPARKEPSLTLKSR